MAGNFVAGDVHVQAALTNLSVAFSQGAEAFKSGRVFPTVAVSKQSDKYHVINRNDWLRADAQQRAPGAESAGGGYGISQNPYYADRYAIHLDIDDPTRANTDPALSNLDADATNYVTEQILLKQEKLFVTDFMGSTGAVWDGASSSTDMTGAAAPSSTTSSFLKWSDIASTPIEDLRGEKNSIAKNTGKMANVLAQGPTVQAALADHPDILDRIKYTERGIVTDGLLASLFGLSDVVTFFATNDTAVEAAAESMSFLTGTEALLCHSPQSAGLRTASAGYRFVWTGLAGMPAQGARIKKFRLEHVESDRIEGEVYFDDVAVESKLGAFFITAA